MLATADLSKFWKVLRMTAFISWNDSWQPVL